MDNLSNKEILIQALLRYKYWLNSTNSPRIAAGIANKQTGIKLTGREYAKLLKNNNLRQ